jgi:hypothetical protein
MKVLRVDRNGYFGECVCVYTIVYFSCAQTYT